MLNAYIRCREILSYVGISRVFSRKNKIRIGFKLNSLGMPRGVLMRSKLLELCPLIDWQKEPPLKQRSSVTLCTRCRKAHRWKTQQRALTYLRSTRRGLSFRLSCPTIRDSHNSLRFFVNSGRSFRFLLLRTNWVLMPPLAGNTLKPYALYR